MNTFHVKVASFKFWALSWEISISSRRITKQMKSVELMLYFCFQVLVLQMERRFRRLKDSGKINWPGLAAWMEVMEISFNSLVGN